jgi:hypothetical protein
MSTFCRKATPPRALPAFAGAPGVAYAEQYRAGVSNLPALIQAQATLASAATNIVNAIHALRIAQSNPRFALWMILQ